MNPHATIAIQKIPRFIPHTNPTPPDESNTTGQVLLQIRMNPTSPDYSERLQPPHNPSVVGSIPTGPTRKNRARHSVVSLATPLLLQLSKTANILGLTSQWDDDEPGRHLYEKEI
jgi:hypothetical protein